MDEWQIFSLIPELQLSMRLLNESIDVISANGLTFVLAPRLLQKRRNRETARQNQCAENEERRSEIRFSGSNRK